jgi:hypothetical protein
MPDTGYLMPDAGYRMSEARCRRPEAGGRRSGARQVAADNGLVGRSTRCRKRQQAAALHTLARDAGVW